MSWARFGAEHSDVYLFPTDTYPGDGSTAVAVGECCGCKITEAPHPDAIWGGTFVTPHLDVFLAHLDQHRAAGHTVPDSAYAQVRAEWDEYMA